jgi:hypothetical protein
MLIVYSKNHVPIRLTLERWAHIVDGHPEMAAERERVLETVERPEIIQAGDFGVLLAARVHPQSLPTPLPQKHLVVAYREVHTQDGFILTAYYTRRLSQTRTILWKP